MRVVASTGDYWLDSFVYRNILACHELSAAQVDPGREHRRVMRKTHPPSVAHGLPKVAVLFFHRAQSVEIVGLVPRGAQVRASRNDIGKMDETAAAGPQDRDLMVTRMTA